METKIKKNTWSTRDLLITAVIGLAFGVLLIPVTFAYAAFLGLGVWVRSVMGGIYYLPAGFSAYVMRKPGAILLVSAVSALVAMPFTPYGLIVLIIGLLTGVIGELVTWLFTRYRNFSMGRLVAAGFAAGLVEFLLILGSLRGSDLDWGVMGVALVVSAAVFAACAALAKVLADSVAKTGVLSNTALGRTVADE
jgi:energy-coupling factor transport system substrate-specific component